MAVGLFPNAYSQQELTMSSAQSAPLQTTLLENFKIFFRDYKRLPVDDLDKLYEDSVVFRDPVQEIRGITALHSYLAATREMVTSCRFEYLDQLSGHDNAYIKWNMHFTHSKFANKPLLVRGVSHIQFNQRIFYHEDIYDLGEMIYDNLPLLGSATRYLKNRMKADHGAKR